MHDWLPRKGEYLAAMYRTEGPGGSFHASDRSHDRPEMLQCHVCTRQAGRFRCLSCWGRPLVCLQCCLMEHRANPFHRIEELQDGNYFVPTQLGAIGLQISLGSKEAGCTCSGGGASGLGKDDADEEWETDEEEEDEGDEGLFWTFATRSGRTPQTFEREMIIVDVSGVHVMPVRFCRCPGSEPDDIQLIQNGLYPSTQRAIRTCFTFSALDSFLLENVECKTSASAFYSRLQRQTDPVFPDSVPVCTLHFSTGPADVPSQNHYQGLLRVSRQWSHLRDLMKHGFGYPERETPGPGDLTYFCVACPQPGFNLEPGWQEDEDQYVSNAAAPCATG